MRGSRNWARNCAKCFSIFCAGLPQAKESEPMQKGEKHQQQHHHHQQRHECQSTRSSMSVNKVINHRIEAPDNTNQLKTKPSSSNMKITASNYDRWHTDPIGHHTPLSLQNWLHDAPGLSSRITSQGINNAPILDPEPSPIATRQSTQAPRRLFTSLSITATEPPQAQEKDWKKWLGGSTIAYTLL